LTVYFDFLCPFVHRLSLWLDQVAQQRGGLNVTWKYFSLEQMNAPDDDWCLWEQPEDYISLIGGSPEYRGLIPFWGAEAARQQGASAFEQFRQALFHARHSGGLDFSLRANVRSIATQVGLDMDRFDADFTDRRLLEAIRHDFEEACNQYKVFGVPTICYDANNTIFLKLMQVPPADDAVPFFEELYRSFTSRHWLAEIKRPGP
jgi:predicted DsbA family dithiol-disulfide isomerase